MKIMPDTNVLFSALLNPQSQLAAAMRLIRDYHQIVLSDYGAAELYRIVAAKRPDLIENEKAFLKELNCEYVNSPLEPNTLITDLKDMPILNAAISADVDIIISGDKHFLALDLPKPKVMKIADFLKKETCLADVP